MGEKSKDLSSLGPKKWRVFLAASLFIVLCLRVVLFVEHLVLLSGSPGSRPALVLASCLDPKQVGFFACLHPSQDGSMSTCEAVSGLPTLQDLWDELLDSAPGELSLEPLAWFPRRTLRTPSSLSSLSQQKSCFLETFVLVLCVCGRWSLELSGPGPRSYGGEGPRQKGHLLSNSCSGFLGLQRFLPFLEAPDHADSSICRCPRARHWAGCFIHIILLNIYIIILESNSFNLHLS